MVLNSKEGVILGAQKLLLYYFNNKDLIPVSYREAIENSIDRLKRDLVRVEDGSRPELILSVKMGTVILQSSLDFFFKYKEEV